MPLNTEEKNTLLKLARSSIEAHIRGKKSAEINPLTKTLLEYSGAFVSLHRDGGLRGCIGLVISDRPLYKTVSDMAVSAATMDPRFPPLETEELEGLVIEISVLSPPRELKDPVEIEVGRHGLYMVKGNHRGLLLPQVATEHGLDRTTFLDQTCLKAGLPPGSWRTGAKTFIFEAEVFREEG